MFCSTLFTLMMRMHRRFHGVRSWLGECAKGQSSRVQLEVSMCQHMRVRQWRHSFFQCPDSPQRKQVMSRRNVVHGIENALRSEANNVRSTFAPVGRLGVHMFANKEKHTFYFSN